MNISNKRELQQILCNNSFDIRFDNFLTIYENYATKQYQPFSFLVNDINLPSNNNLRFEKNLVEQI